MPNRLLKPHNPKLATAFDYQNRAVTNGKDCSNVQLERKAYTTMYLFSEKSLLKPLKK
jgi:hypothetical protein